MPHAYICDALRTPFGRYGGGLSAIRTDDLAALPIKALIERHAGVDWAALDDVVLGCANQAGEDNRNVARMALLLAGLPQEVPGTTVNRLCGSSLDALAIAARAIAAGEAELVIAGGVEGMSRAPFVLGKATAAFSRTAALEDTTMGWRFVNPRMQSMYGVDTMPETAENVAADVRDSPRRSGRVRPAQPAADRGGYRTRLLFHGNDSREHSREDRHDRVCRRRAPSRRDDARGPGEAEADRTARRNGHGGQRLGCERRSRRDDRGVRTRGRTPRAHSARTRRGVGRRRRGAAR